MIKIPVLEIDKVYQIVSVMERMNMQWQFLHFKGKS